MARLLLVEDDTRTRDLFSQFFRMKGYQVLEAKDGEEAVALAGQQPFDLIVMDVKMPKLDGLEAFHRIRAGCPSSKVLLMTGFTMKPEELNHVLQESTVAYVHKPFTFDQLTAVISRLMEAPSSAESSDAASSDVDGGAS